MNILLKIDEDFIKNKSNLVGIKCKDYLKKLLSPNAPTDNSMNDDLEEELQGIKEVYELYGLIHKRYITASKGLALMREIYLNWIFGRCPRVVCYKQVLIPIGIREDTKYRKVKVYCPICCRAYKPCRYKGRNISLDGHILELLLLKFFFWIILI